MHVAKKGDESSSNIATEGAAQNRFNWVKTTEAGSTIVFMSELQKYLWDDTLIKPIVVIK